MYAIRSRAITTMLATPSYISQPYAPPHAPSLLSSVFLSMVPSLISTTFPTSALTLSALNALVYNVDISVLLVAGAQYTSTRGNETRPSE